LFIPSGSYYIGKRIVAYRNGYCVSCATTRRIDGIRAFRLFHLFFVPFVPLGFARIWRCSVCRYNPHADLRAGLMGNFIWALLFGIMSVTGWFEAKPNPKTDWLILVGLWMVFALLLCRAIFMTRRYLAIRTAVQKERYQNPADDTVCPFCGSMFMLGERVICQYCGVERIAK
jgi:uncharacterized membrane protein YccF (DUF307 family)